MDSTYPDSIEHQRFLHTCRFIYFLLHTCIYLFPKTGNTAHQCRANLLNGCLNIRRAKINANLHSLMDTEITPCFLEHMSQGKEVHRYILIGHRSQTVIMCMELFQVAGMMKHYSFRFTRCSGCIEDIRQIIIRSTVRAFFHHIILQKSLSHRHKLIKIDRRYVTRVFHHRTVKDNQLLQRRTETKDTESSIILILFTYKKVTYLCIIDNILRLSRRTGCIERNGNSPVGECPKVHIKPFGLILRKDSNIFLFLPVPQMRWQPASLFRRIDSR